jgi:tetratricopeptide (TPR) repeat protein
MAEIADLPEAAFAPLLREGLRHHAGGRLTEAAVCYQGAHDKNPEDPDALLLLGIVARQNRQFPAAVRLTTLAAGLRPQAAHIHLNLALAYLGGRDLERAAASARESIALDPNNGKAWLCLGEIEKSRSDFKAALAAFARALQLPSGAARAAVALGSQLCLEKRYEEALSVFARGLAAEPANADLHFSIAAANAALGKTRQAKAAYAMALQHRPNFPEAHLSLGNLLYDTGTFLSAAASYSRAISLRPEYAKAHCNLGNALAAMGRHQQAIPCYERALALNPNTTAARNNLGNALLHRRDYVRAEECFRHALQHEPHSPEHHNSLGNALLQQHRDAEAESCYAKALALRPDYAAAHINLANTLLQLGRTEEMKRHYQRGVELDPASAGGQYNLALLCLREGNYLEGWHRHEWRWEFREIHQTRRNFPKPQWRGLPLHGETILLHAEQGLGDTLQFVRYAPMVAARGGRVILEVQPRLQKLIEGMEGVKHVVTRGHALPEFAVHCPLMSLPLAFHTTLESIPATTPYLRVDRATVAAAWQAYPRLDERLRVGLAWSGNPRHKGDAQRSIPLEQLVPLAEAREAVFYSLQFGPAAEQIAAMPTRFPLIDASSRSKDFAETAALAATLDLVISVDTSIAHLAGAMGLPLWVMLQHLPDWRWLEERQDSPWYPTARLFRQPARGDWAALVEAVREALRDFTRQPA